MKKISTEMALLLHSLIAQESGGSTGIRDLGLLDSALQSAFQTFDGKDLYPTKTEKAARLGYSLISNHSFVDGHLGRFHVLATVHSAAVNIGVHASF